MEQTNMNKDIVGVVVKAYRELPQDVVLALSRGNDFVSVVEPKGNHIPVLVNGELQNKPAQRYVVIDYMNPMIRNNWEDYKAHTLALYQMFKAIPEEYWHKC